MKKFIKEFWVELVILLAILMAVFLLVEQFSIRYTIFRAFRKLSGSLREVTNQLGAAFESYLAGFTVSDLLGWLLLLAALVVILLRLRWRFLNSARWSSTTCPVCGQPVRRMHRRRRDRFFSKLLLIQSHRYRCSDPACSWSGLRKPGRQNRRKQDVLGDYEAI
ncbi:MAG: hypothetical protein JW862_19240 [Anaerolineales bacterium]|nr:hypothetical protein [Anaerolineales bacterium]